MNTNLSQVLADQHEHDAGAVYSIRHLGLIESHLCINTRSDGHGGLWMREQLSREGSHSAIALVN
jgi:hypothetical protein